MQLEPKKEGVLIWKIMWEQNMEVHNMENSTATKDRDNINMENAIGSKDKGTNDMKYATGIKNGEGINDIKYKFGRMIIKKNGINNGIIKQYIYIIY